MRRLLLPLAVLAGCYRQEPVDPTVEIRHELQAVSSENAWLHARLAAASDWTAVDAARAREAMATTATTRAFVAVREALAPDIRVGRADVILRDGDVDVALMPVEPIGFAGDSALFSPEGQRSLERIAGVLRRQPDLDLEIATRVTGSPVVTLEDWDRAHTRSLAIAWALQDLGVSPSRITVVTRPTVPVASGTPAAATLPRRAIVDVVLRPSPSHGPRPEGTIEEGPLLGVVR